MPRTDRKGVRHPVESDAWNPAEDYPHVKDCPDCLAQDWGRNLVQMVEAQLELPIPLPR